MILRWAVTCFLLFAFSTDTAFTQPLPCFHADSTVHYYEAVSVSSGITWSEANAQASQTGGYLATMTSQAENDFIFNLIDDTVYWYERPNGRLAGPSHNGRSFPEERSVAAGLALVKTGTVERSVGYVIGDAEVQDHGAQKDAQPGSRQ